MRRPHCSRAAALLPLLLAAALILLCGPGAVRAGAAWGADAGVDYAGVPGQHGPLNQLDLYYPEGDAPGLRPIVVYVHGGSWMKGDKKNKIEDKVRLFTDAGYLFASVNYRLSPDLSAQSPVEFNPGRIRFPTHPDDVARAIAWVADKASGYGGDPDSIFLIGHSAGAHLVSLIGTDPAYLEDSGASADQVVGVVPLDTAAFDIVRSATPTGPAPGRANLLFWNVFGTPSEEAAEPRWHDASPVSHADPRDPRHLFVTQSASTNRIEINREMASALGQAGDSVVTVPLDHSGINAAVGAPGDPTGQSAAIMDFMAERFAAHPPLRVSIRKRPPKRATIGRKARKRKVVFKFRANRVAHGLQCRIDGRKLRKCSSPVKYRLKRGRHTFRVRAVYPSGRVSPHRRIKFRIVKKGHRPR